MEQVETSEERDAPPICVTRQFSIPKRQGETNEDRVSSSVAPGICAVSDGASVSFDPSAWAQILVDRFSIDQNVTTEWLSQSVDAYRTKYNRDDMEWMLQAAFDRGSFATLLAVASTPDHKAMRVTAIGDSLCVVVDGDNILVTIPIIDAADFDKSPILLSTNYAENQIWTAEALDECQRSIPVASLSDPKVLLMTDAIGKWLLEDRDNRIQRLLSLITEEEFAAFVEEERTHQRMRRDDSTLVILEPRRELPANN